MVQINHNFSSISELLQVFDDKNIDLTSDKILIQVFTSIFDKEFIETNLKSILQNLPNSTIIGTTTAGEIIDSKMSEKNFFLSISVFKSTSIKSTYLIEEDSHQLGEKISSEIFKDDTCKCIISFCDGIKHNGDVYLKVLNDKNNNNVTIAGGLSSDIQKTSKTYIIHQDKVFKNGAVAVGLYGKDLAVYQDYNLGWRGVGPEFTITKSNGSQVYEINNKPIKKIYAEVLGSEVVQNMPNSTIEFPLIKKDSKVQSSISMIASLDDSVIYASKLNEGEKVQFGVISSYLVNQYDFSKKIDLHKSNIQASFIYSCTARKQFLGKSMESIFEKVSTIAPSAGFFTDREFYHSDIEPSLLNITTTILFLSEKNDKAKPITENATFNLIDYISKELNQKERKLEHNEKLLSEYLHGIDNNMIVSKGDLKGNITYANKKFSEISGYSIKELIGKPHNIVRHPNEAKETYKNLWDTITKGSIWSGNLENLSKNGSTYYVKSTIIPIHDENDEIYEYMSIREDISKLIETQKAYQKEKHFSDTLLKHLKI